MNVDGLRELDLMAAKLEATIHKLSQVKQANFSETLKGFARSQPLYLRRPRKYQTGL